LKKETKETKDEERLSKGRYTNKSTETVDTDKERKEWRRLSYKTIHTNQRKSYNESSMINEKVKLTTSTEKKIPF
jgi:hypothetical protein